MSDKNGAVIQSLADSGSAVVFWSLGDDGMAEVEAVRPEIGGTEEVGP
jgi:hypothetical protein